MRSCILHTILAVLSPKLFVCNFFHRVIHRAAPSTAMASDMSAAAAGCGPDVQREQWKQVREHIHRAEQRLLDLQFDYQPKVNAVEALKLDLRQTTKDSQDCETNSLSLGRATLEAFKKLQVTEGGACRTACRTACRKYVCSAVQQLLAGKPHAHAPVALQRFCRDGGLRAAS